MLYNYIACKKNKQNYQDVIDKLRADYKTSVSLINEAVNDIEAYKEALGLDAFIEYVAQSHAFCRPHYTGEVIPFSRTKKGKKWKCFSVSSDPFYILKNIERNRLGIISAVHPKFYVRKHSKRGLIVYLAGCERRFVTGALAPNFFRSVNANNIQEVLDQGKCYVKTKLLIPISRTAENHFEKREDMDENVSQKEKDKYEEAHRLSETLEKYCTDIFDGLVEVSPLYYDEISG